jgi:hypothetical protein
VQDRTPSQILSLSAFAGDSLFRLGFGQTCVNVYGCYN